LVAAGSADASRVLEGCRIAEERITTFGAVGDVLAAVCANGVVAAYDITGHARDEQTGRVTFSGTPSQRWNHLVGRPTPPKPWGRRLGAWPVKFVETEMLGRQLAVVTRNARCGLSR